MPSEPDSMISSILGSNIQAAVILLEHLDSTPATPPNRVQANRKENAPSTAIVALCDAALESAANRLEYLSHKVERGTKPDALDGGRGWLENHLPAEIAGDVREVHTVRNAIMHAHLWVGVVGYDDNRERVWIVSPTLSLPPRYRKRLDGILDANTLQTLRLGMNLVPTRVWRADAYLAFRTMVDVLKAFQVLHPKVADIDSNSLGYGARWRSVSEIAATLALPEDPSFPRRR